MTITKAALAESWNNAVGIVKGYRFDEEIVVGLLIEARDFSLLQSDQTVSEAHSAS
jgi:hypothetical protein